MRKPTSFKIDIPANQIDGIQHRVAHFDWNAVPDAGGWSAGIGLQELKKIANYWTTTYDWRKAERELNRFPHFSIEIEGQTLHFLHVRGSARRPLILSHGWPGSFFEFYQVIERLAFPERFGGRAEDGFDVVVPSLPGYGFSGTPARIIGPRTTAKLFNALMIEGLGYTRYIAQGGDWGSAVSAWMAHDYPQSCIALHLNMVLIQAKDAIASTDEELSHQRLRQAKGQEEGGYSHLQSSRPQTLAIGMSDSPLGVAAWILEKFAAWSDLPWHDGVPDLSARYSLDQLLTNVMIYLVTNSFASSTWMYRGRVLERSSSFEAGSSVVVPTAVAAFPDPVFAPPPRSQVEKSYALKQWTDMPRGGHFAAMEEPLLLVSDIQAFCGSLPSAGFTDD